MATRDVFKPVLGLVEEGVTHEIPEGQPDIPNFDYIARVANIKRQKMRPKYIKDMEFVVSQIISYTIHKFSCRIFESEVETLHSF